MAKVNLKPSGIALVDSTRAEFNENDYAASVYAYRSYSVKATGADYADIILSDPIKWTMTEDQGGTSYSYYAWELTIPTGAYAVIGYPNRGNPDGPDTLTVRVYKNAAAGSAGAGESGYVYLVTTGSTCTASYTEELGEDYEYVGTECWIPSYFRAYAAYAEITAGDAVGVGGAVRDASPVVCVGGVIRSASTAKCVGGIIKS